jgi:hypothetical protein
MSAITTLRLLDVGYRKAEGSVWLFDRLIVVGDRPKTPPAIASTCYLLFNPYAAKGGDWISLTQ